MPSAPKGASGCEGGASPARKARAWPSSMRARAEGAAPFARGASDQAVRGFAAQAEHLPYSSIL